MLGPTCQSLPGVNQHRSRGRGNRGAPTSARGPSVPARLAQRAPETGTRPVWRPARVPAPPLGTRGIQGAEQHEPAGMWWRVDLHPSHCAPRQATQETTKQGHNLQWSSRGCGRGGACPGRSNGEAGQSKQGSGDKFCPPSHRRDPAGFGRGAGCGRGLQGSLGTSSCKCLGTSVGHPGLKHCAGGAGASRDQRWA